MFLHLTESYLNCDATTVDVDAVIEYSSSDLSKDTKFDGIMSRAVKLLDSYIVALRSDKRSGFLLTYDTDIVNRRLINLDCSALELAHFHVRHGMKSLPYELARTFYQRILTVMKADLAGTSLLDTFDLNPLIFIHFFFTQIKS